MEKCGLNLIKTQRLKDIKAVEVFEVEELAEEIVEGIELDSNIAAREVFAVEELAEELVEGTELAKRKDSKAATMDVFAVEELAEEIVEGTIDFVDFR
ncbi:hypothetical protein Ddye_013073 [Dipteronia dyeriana]|uniref:Uncharacterized protein n=1 Tax=Dipteronia dyeriana TaxID=168575 RepID=A0AAE0CJ94_9ROSI|nr:hypothetical protein Ddye_013073 [Dipteronia dyeriana]